MQKHIVDQGLRQAHQVQVQVDVVDAGTTAPATLQLFNKNALINKSILLCQLLQACRQMALRCLTQSLFDAITNGFLYGWVLHRKVLGILDQQNAVVQKEAHIAAVGFLNFQLETARFKFTLLVKQSLVCFVSGHLMESLNNPVSFKTDKVQRFIYGAVGRHEHLNPFQRFNANRQSRSARMTTKGHLSNALHLQFIRNRICHTPTLYTAQNYTFWGGTPSRTTFGTPGRRADP